MSQNLKCLKTSLYSAHLHYQINNLTSHLRIKPVAVSLSFVPCPSVMGSPGLSDGPPQSGDEEALRGLAGRSHQQADAAHQRQTAAPQNLRRAVEPAEAGAEQGVG